MEGTVITGENLNSGKDKAMQLVGFNLGNDLFGVNILNVQEIIRTVPITPIPDSQGFIEGVINLRGNIIPVINLRKRLNLMTGEVEATNLWIVILNVNQRVTGFIVEHVTQVLKITTDSIKPAPDIVVAGLQNHYITGVCKMGESLLVLLDFNQILRADEIELLEASLLSSHMLSG